jgi:uncharacterized membrane protein YfcA
MALLSMFWAPATVLGVTAPALFIGNASRALMLRCELDWPTAARFCSAAVPTAFFASLAAAAMPADLLKLILAGFLFIFVFQELRGSAAAAHAEPPRPAGGWLAFVGGAISGIVSGLSGVGGFISSPILHRLGLPPKTLVATSAFGMALTHVAKVIGFASAQVVTVALIPAIAALAAGIVAGNALGTRVLSKLSRETFRRILITAVAIGAVQLAWTALGPGR